MLRPERPREVLTNISRDSSNGSTGTCNQHWRWLITTPPPSTTTVGHVRLVIIGINVNRSSTLKISDERTESVNNTRIGDSRPHLIDCRLIIFGGQVLSGSNGGEAE